MLLKVLTSLSFLLGVGALACWPWVYRQRPGLHGGPALGRELAEFEVMLAGYIGVSVFAFVTAACLAMLLVNQAKDQYRDLTNRNVQDLVEGSLEDIRNRGKLDS